VYTNGSAHSDSKRQDGWYDRDRNEYHLGDEGKDDEDEDGDVYHHSDDKEITKPLMKPTRYCNCNEGMQCACIGKRAQVTSRIIN
jgi:hypothetical protein